MSTEVWWSHHHPFKSGLTGETAQQYCDAYEKASGKQWTQPLGFKHANLEVAIDALKRAKKLEASAIRDAIAATDYQSIVGPITWKGGADQSGAERLHHAAGRRAVGEGREVQVRLERRLQQVCAEHPARQPVRADSIFLTATHGISEVRPPRRTRGGRQRKSFMTVLLELDGVSKSYGALKAVDAVSLAVEDGEALAVIGPNGAGKTTLFNLISGDVAPSKGRVLFDGADMTAMAPHARSRLGIGRSYQIPHPFANMSVFENLLVGAIYRRRQERARQLPALLRRAAGDRALRQGQCAGADADLAPAQTAGAGAGAGDPAASCCCSTRSPAGSPNSNAANWSRPSRTIHANGTTIVWIEHIVHALVSVASRLVVMNFGQILAQGDPREVMAEPSVREVYMGMPVS